MDLSGREGGGLVAMPIDRETKREGKREREREREREPGRKTEKEDRVGPDELLKHQRRRRLKHILCTVYLANSQ